MSERSESANSPNSMNVTVDDVQARIDLLKQARETHLGHVQTLNGGIAELENMRDIIAADAERRRENLPVEEPAEVPAEV